MASAVKLREVVYTPEWPMAVEKDNTPTVIRLFTPKPHQTGCICPLCKKAPQ